MSDAKYEYRRKPDKYRQPLRPAEAQKRLQLIPAEAQKELQQYQRKPIQQPIYQQPIQKQRFYQQSLYPAEAQKGLQQYQKPIYQQSILSDDTYEFMKNQLISEIDYFAKDNILEEILVINDLPKLKSNQISNIYKLLQLRQKTAFNTVGKYDSQVVDYGEDFMKKIQIITYFFSLDNLKCIYTGYKVTVPENIKKIILNCSVLFKKSWEEFMLSPLKLTDDEKKDVSDFSNLINEEHIVPSSIYGRIMPMVCDPHNVFPVLTMLNGYRANFIFTDNIVDPNDSFCNINGSVCSINNKSDWFKNISQDIQKQITANCVNRKYTVAENIEEPGCPGNYGKLHEQIKKTLPGSDPKFNEECKKIIGNAYPGNGEDIENVSCKFGSGFIEMSNKAKGTIARGILYFHLYYYYNYIANDLFNDDYKKNHYNTISKFDHLYYGDSEKFLDNNRLVKYAKWCVMYPPNEDEIKRNELIYKIYGTENIFITASISKKIIIRLLLDTFFDINTNTFAGYLKH